MFSVTVNAIVVFLCGLIGAVLKKFKNDRISESAMVALGLAIVVVGIIDLFEVQHVFSLILSVVLGGILGELLHIEDGLNRFGAFLQKKITKDRYDENGNLLPNTFGEGVISGTILFCVDAQVIFGSIAAGMGEHEILLIKSGLDGTIALFLAMKLGYGVMFSSIPVLIQGGVASRLVAKPGSSDYGAITAVLGYYGNVRKLFKVSAGSFIPAPKVDSAVVRIDLYKEPKYKPKNEKLFRDLIKAAFEMRRKTLVNAISAKMPSVSKDKLIEAIRSLGHPDTVRGERLSTEEFARLSDFLA